ncbi:restriction endonuclease subunit S [Aeromonas veronii]|uniref:restriction endonuclease subunit S n=1 Tax=Aeromonas veronii TaxID=654 RepID=UPI00226CBCF1|nr:restriction endonuclease subunit S [Aeromonas veronii]MCX9105237.1 restriction endonuclease subunit S [Aeromonas veronii]MCX9120684.1 restriction endonuclease subunit S [Aeromonas veronii]
MTTGWQTRKLCEVSDTFDGPHATPKTVDSGPIYLGIGALQDGVINLSDTRHVTDDDFTVWTRRVRPQANDVVFSYETRIGQAAIIPDGLECCLGRRMGLIRFNQEKVIPRFFLYQYISPQFRDFLESKTIRGATVDRVSIKDFPSFPILVAPLSEQRRIVAILDEAFEAIAVARVNAEQNRQNARALFESYLQSVFSQRGEGWVETTIGNQVDFLAGFAFKSTQYTESKDGIRLIRGDNIVQGQLRWDGVKYLPRASAENYSQFYFEENDIVLAMDRPWVAAGLKVACITNNDLPALQVQRTARLRVKPNIHWKYLFHMIRSSKFVTYLLDGQTGLGVPHISGKQILSFEFAMPPLNQQQLIVQKLDALDDKTQRLESLYQRKIAALDELKQSLLQQAFSGQL